MIHKPTWNMTLSQNLLYCNANPAKNYNGATTCTWAPTGGVANCNASSCWVSAAVDVINYHFYNYQTEPEVISARISTIAAFVSPMDKAKPLISGEGGTGCSAASLVGCPSSRMWRDDSSSAGFIPRLYALLWSYGLSSWQPCGIVGNWWTAYTAGGTLYSNAALTPEGVAYNTTYDWLVGSTPASNPWCTTRVNPTPGKIQSIHVLSRGITRQHNSSGMRNSVLEELMESPTLIVQLLPTLRSVATRVTRCCRGLMAGMTLITQLTVRGTPSMREG
jgi:hypothetical protein